MELSIFADMLFIAVQSPKDITLHAVVRPKNRIAYGNN